MRIEWFEDVFCRLHALRRSTDTEAHSIRLRCRRFFYARHQTAMAAGAAAAAAANAPERQIQVVVDAHQVFRPNAVFASQRLHCLPTAVHVSSRFSEHDLFIFKSAL